MENRTFKTEWMNQLFNDLKNAEEVEFNLSGTDIYPYSNEIKEFNSIDNKIEVVLNDDKKLYIQDDLGFVGVNELYNKAYVFNNDFKVILN